MCQSDFPAYRGQMEYVCLHCGQRYPGDSLLYTCPSCGDTYRDAWTDALGHSWDAGRVTIPATEDTDGERTFTCTRCGAERTEVIPKTGETPCDGGANCPGRRICRQPGTGHMRASTLP